MAIKVQTGSTLAFERFWGWLRGHTNCILRAGSPDVWLFDDDDLHWHLEEDRSQGPVVQLIRGKRLFAEMVMEVGAVAFVQVTSEGAPGEETTLFELINGDAEAEAVYHFQMAHPFDEELSAHAGGGLKH